MKPGVYLIESSDLREFLHSRGIKLDEKEVLLMALKHLRRGALEGACNEKYIEATEQCFRMLRDFVEEQLNEEKIQIE